MKQSFVAGLAAIGAFLLPFGVAGAETAAGVPAGGDVVRQLSVVLAAAEVAGGGDGVLSLQVERKAPLGPGSAITLDVNGRQVAVVQLWKNDLDTQVRIPAEALQVGENILTLRAAGGADDGAVTSPASLVTLADDVSFLPPASARPLANLLTMVAFGLIGLLILSGFVLTLRTSVADRRERQINAARFARVPANDVGPITSEIRAAE
jgi:hypothetical protein